MVWLLDVKLLRPSAGDCEGINRGCDSVGGAVIRFGGAIESELRPLQVEKNLQGFAVTPGRT